MSSANLTWGLVYTPSRLYTEQKAAGTGHMPVGAQCFCRIGSDQLVFEMETGQQLVCQEMRLQCTESGAEFGKTSAWLLPSVSANHYACAGAAVIFLCVKQPVLPPKGFTKLVQSARGSFPLISFRFPLKAMNTLN